MQDSLGGARARGAKTRETRKKTQGSAVSAGQLAESAAEGAADNRESEERTRLGYSGRAGAPPARLAQQRNKGEKAGEVRENNGRVGSGCKIGGGSSCGGMKWAWAGWRCGGRGPQARLVRAAAAAERHARRGGATTAVRSGAAPIDGPQSWGGWRRRGQRPACARRQRHARAAAGITRSVAARLSRWRRAPARRCGRRPGRRLQPRPLQSPGLPPRSWETAPPAVRRLRVLGGAGREGPRVGGQRARGQRQCAGPAGRPGGRGPAAAAGERGSRPRLPQPCRSPSPGPPAMRGAHPWPPRPPAGLRREQRRRWRAARGPPAAGAGPAAARRSSRSRRSPPQRTGALQGARSGGAQAVGWGFQAAAAAAAAAGGGSGRRTFAGADHAADAADGVRVVAGADA